MKIHDEVSKIRKPKFEVNPLIINRWSSRAMTGEEISDKELFTLFEAASYAASAYNEQPWKFIYAKRGSKYWAKFVSFLVEFNQSWADKASALVVILSKKRFTKDDMPNRTHSYDTGAASAYLGLQAETMGLNVREMSGIYYEKIKQNLDIPKEFIVEAMMAIGKRGETKNLPINLRAKNEPTPRKNINEFISEGVFK